MAHGSALPDLWSVRRCCHLFLPVPAAMALALALAVRSAAYQGRTLTCDAMEGRAVGAPGAAHWRSRSLYTQVCRAVAMRSCPWDMGRQSVYRHSGLGVKAQWASGVLKKFLS